MASGVLYFDSGYCWLFSLMIRDLSLTYVLGFFLSVVNLTLIDLPGLTKVAVGTIFMLSFFLYFLLKFIFHGLKFFIMFVKFFKLEMFVYGRGATRKCCSRNRNNGSFIC